VTYVGRPAPPAASRPAAALRTRLLDLLDAVYRFVSELHEWIAPPETFRARLELYDRIDDADLLLAGAQCLLLKLTGWLCVSAGGGAHTPAAGARARQGARAPTSVEIVLAEATWRDEHLVRLLRERLGRLVQDAPAIGLTLEALQVPPMASPNLFFGRRVCHTARRQRRPDQLRPLYARRRVDARRVPAQRPRR